MRCPRWISLAVASLALDLAERDAAQQRAYINRVKLELEGAKRALPGLVNRVLECKREIRQLDVDRKFSVDHITRQPIRPD